MTTDLHSEALALLKDLIRTPSFSREEEGTAAIIEGYLAAHGIPFFRKHNNVWARNLHFDPALPTILLNSHHDTVRPNEGYTVDPFGAVERDGKLYGLGSNDAGASLAGLFAAFAYYYPKRMRYNLIFAATAEEEISGANGIAALLGDLGEIFGAIVGEPTGMDAAVAEKGLVVIDCIARGTASHAAHENRDSAILHAVEDIIRIRDHAFDKVSDLLGPVKATVTIVQAGTQHNVVPDHANFTIDVRTNEHYTNEEVVAIIRDLLRSEVRPRSLRLNASRIAADHPLVQAAQAEGCRLFGSPTLSDQALMPFPSVKIGIGDSRRSHTADEFIYLDELTTGIDTYIRILRHML
jgi:acetylornithine deacetylase